MEIERIPRSLALCVRNIIKKLVGTIFTSRYRCVRYSVQLVISFDPEIIKYLRKAVRQ